LWQSPPSGRCYWSKPDSAIGTSDIVSETPDAVAAQEQLLTLVPLDVPQQQCVQSVPHGDGDLAALSCGASQTSSGPDDSAFYLYLDSAAVDVSFRLHMAGIGLEQVDDDGVTVCADKGLLRVRPRRRAGRPGGAFRNRRRRCRHRVDRRRVRPERSISDPGGAGAFPTLWEWWLTHGAVPR